MKFEVDVINVDIDSDIIYIDKIDKIKYLHVEIYVSTNQVCKHFL